MGEGDDINVNEEGEADLSDTDPVVAEEPQEYDEERISEYSENQLQEEQYGDEQPIHEDQ